MDSFSLDSYSGGDDFLQTAGTFFQQNPGIILGLLVVLVLWAAYCLWMSYEDEGFSPTHMAPYISRDGIGEDEDFDVSECEPERPGPVLSQGPDAWHGSAERRQMSKRQAARIQQRKQKQMSRRQQRDSQRQRRNKRQGSNRRQRRQGQGAKEHYYGYEENLETRMQSPLTDDEFAAIMHGERLD